MQLSTEHKLQKCLPSLYRKGSMSLLYDQLCLRQRKQQVTKVNRIIPINLHVSLKLTFFIFLLALFIFIHLLSISCSSLRALLEAVWSVPSAYLFRDLNTFLGKSHSLSQTSFWIFPLLGCLDLLVFSYLVLPSLTYFPFSPPLPVRSKCCGIIYHLLTN